MNKSNTLPVIAIKSAVVTYGNDVDEAIAMAKEAIEVYVESLVEHGEEIPTENNTLEYSITVQPYIPKKA